MASHIQTTALKGHLHFADAERRSAATVQNLPCCCCHRPPGHGCQVWCVMHCRAWRENARQEMSFDAARLLLSSLSQRGNSLAANEFEGGMSPVCAVEACAMRLAHPAALCVTRGEKLVRRRRASRARALQLTLAAICVICVNLWQKPAAAAMEAAPPSTSAGPARPALAYSAPPR
jgi:hypothetical protein